MARVLRVGVVGLGRLAGTVVKELTGFNMLERFTCANGPRSIDFELVWRPLIEWIRSDLKKIFFNWTGLLIRFEVRRQFSDSKIIKTVVAGL